MTHLGDDHARGCQGREYTCTCGYDAQKESELVEALRQRDEAREALKATITREMVDRLVGAEIDAVLAYTGGGAPSMEKEAELNHELVEARNAVRNAASAVALKQEDGK